MGRGGSTTRELAGEDLLYGSQTIPRLGSEELVPLGQLPLDCPGCRSEGTTWYPCAGHREMFEQSRASLAPLGPHPIDCELCQYDWGKTSMGLTEVKRWYPCAGHTLLRAEKKRAR